MTRRGVMKGGAAGALSIALAGSLDSIFQTSAGADVGEAEGYGPLIPDPKGILDLPKGRPPQHLRSPEQIARVFCGLPLLSPGLIDVGLWRPEDLFTERDMRILCGVACKE